MLNDQGHQWEEPVQPWSHQDHFTTIMDEVMGGIKVTKLLT